ncbi:CHRD domain-containing protein [Tanticharoenia sakaeratensis]|uniref:CHRD domain-containing protein n=1 Tax=Tanticharoenia sakaeratensis NBRC 103193 TaxID=1231623 RepID=A0A0D6MI81_9PROT|nr:CHRD domain-containing protein [Tanticharoenia sakaeratensis]GAN53216.1 hypothetical protein Tasa_009_011 [Tanticharoenia sakaeratensis NBRC 103193]GBQ21280.1 hypothetical protein AA103193_1676 [Tanticharoenia sakaeratensis NBRC 103193]
MRYRSITALALGLAVSLPASAEVLHVQGQFKVEHGATNTVGGGIGGKLDTVKDTLTYHLHYRGLTGPINAIHLHGPADDGQDAGVLVPVPGPYTTKMHGVLHLTADQVKDIQDGKTYFNLHTAAHADGEARAQLMAK